MSTYSNSAREVEMPDGNVVVLHSEPTGGANTTSNIKKFKYDDNGHVTESSAANATDLNLNSYSTPTTGSTDIGTSDAVQTAIGKLDHQSHIDQTNILSVWNKVGKNNFNYTYVGDGNNYGKTFTSAHATFEVQSDNTALKITTDGAVTTGNPYIFFMDENGDYINFKKWFDGRHYLTGIPSGASVSTHRIFYKADSQASVSLSSDTLLPDLSTATNVYIGIQVQTGQNYGSTGILYQPMIILDTIYASDPSYESASLPNSDLTQLEAEDRAALAEVVDSGAKNLFNPVNVSSTAYGTWDASTGTFTQTGTDTKANLNLTLKARTSSTASWNEIFTNRDIATNGVVSIPFTCPTNATEFRIGHNGSSQDAVMVMTGFNVTTGTQCVVQLNVTNTVQASGKYSWKDIMICTKAAFGVSKNFTPYRPPYSQMFPKKNSDENITDAIAANYHDGIVTGWATSIAGYTERWCVVRTYDLHDTMDRRIQIAEVYATSGWQKMRYFNGTSWSEWT